MNDDETIEELIAGRAVHALSAEDDRRLDAVLASDTEARARLEDARDTAAALAEATPAVAPPARIRAELLALIGGDTAHGPDAADSSDASDDDAAEQSDAVDDDAAGPSDAVDDAVPSPPAAAPARSGARRGWFALAASVAVVAAIGVGALTFSDFFSRDEAVVALDRIEAADDARAAEAPLADGGSLEMHWSHSVGEVVVVTDEMPALPDDLAYEMWFVRGETPISAGVVDIERGEPTLLDGELAPGDVVAVTVEQSGGSPTGQPTTDPIAAIPAE